MGDDARVTMGHISAGGHQTPMCSPVTDRLGLN